MLYCRERRIPCLLIDPLSRYEGGAKQPCEVAEHGDVMLPRADHDMLHALQLRYCILWRYHKRQVSLMASDVLVFSAQSIVC